ncbi:hypothetical protein RCTIPTONUS_77 [Rhodobacter phage RcTiptonus]|nr:hypothetical protein RCTIPTONUS_77 [Rhodobacter phage RcTiptonus]
MPDGSEVFIAPGMERRCSDADREAVRAAMTEEVQGWVTELLELYPDTDPIEDSEGDAEEGEAEEIDLDALDDDSVSALCEHLGLKGKTIKAKRAALADVDPTELAAAYAELAEGDGEEEGEEFDLDAVVQDEEVLAALCEHFEIKAKTAKLKIAALKKLDIDDVAAAYAEMTEEGDGEEDGEEAEDVDIDSLDDDEIDALADHFKIKGKTKALKVSALKKLDIADVTAAYVELTGDDGEGDGEEEGDGDEEGGYTEAELKALQLEDLQQIAEEWELPAPKLAKTAKLAEKKTAYIKAILKAQDAE